MKGFGGVIGRVGLALAFLVGAFGGVEVGGEDAVGGGGFGDGEGFGDFGGGEVDAVLGKEMELVDA